MQCRYMLLRVAPLNICLEVDPVGRDDGECIPNGIQQIFAAKNIAITSLLNLLTGYVCVSIVTSVTTRSDF